MESFLRRATLFCFCSSSNAVLRAASPLRFGALNSDPMEFQLVGAIGSSYILETSENLRDWLPFKTNFSINGFWNITDDAWTNSPRRFYRATAP